MIIALTFAMLAMPHPKPAPPPAPETALTDDEVRSRALTYLGSIDTPISAERWRALGPRAATVLAPIAQDETALPTRRAKALGGLTLAAPEQAAPLVKQFAKDEKEPLVVRLTAVRGASSALGTKAAAQELSPLLSSAKSEHVRAAAAEVIASSGGCAQVKAQVAREPSESRPAYHRALAHCP